MADAVTLNGISVTYDDVGTGTDVVVLVHGHPFNRSMWAPQFAAVTGAGWRAIAPDLRGYGATQVVPGPTTLATFASDIAALLDRLGIEGVVLAGLSMGGQIVMECARLYPARVRGLLLAATLPQAESEDGKQRRRDMADRLLREGMHPYADEVLPRMLAPRSIAAFPDVAAHVRTMMQTTDPEGAAAALRGRAVRPSYDATLEHLTVPASIIVGDEDAFTTRADADRMHALVKTSELVWMEQVGHMPNLERPDAFNQALVKLLERVRP